VAAYGRVRVAVLRLLRNRDLALLFSGQAVSMVGDGMFNVALAWRVYQSYNAPAALSLVGIAFFVPRLFAILGGGVVSDRFDRRLTMIGADAGRTLTVTGLAVINLSGNSELIAIVVLVAVQSLIGSLFMPAESALLPQLVRPDQLNAANGLRGMIQSLAFAMVGPALGGWITGTAGPSAAFGSDAVTYLVSILTLALMRPRPSSRSAARTSMIAEARQGVAYVAGRPWLWGPILASSLSQFLYAGPNQALVPYVVKYDLHASATALGLVFTAGGVGTMVGGLIIGRVPTPRRIVAPMVVLWALGMVSLSGVGLAHNVWQAALAVFCWNLFLWSGEVLWLTLLGLSVPNRIRGRVSSIDFVGSYWLIPLSMALTGPVAGLIGPRLLLVAAGVGGGLSVLSTLAVPHVTQPEYAEASPADEGIC